MANLETSLQQPSTSIENTILKATTSGQNEITSKKLIISDDIPTLLTCNDNTNNCE